MEFKILFLLICSASILEATERIPMKKVISKINYYKSGEHISKQALSDMYKMHEGGLIMNVSLTKKSKEYIVPLLLNSMAPKMWVISDKCESSFCDTTTQKLPQVQDRNKKVDSGLVEGYNQTFTVKFLTHQLHKKDVQYDVLVTDSVSDNVAKCVGESSGAIPLFDSDLWEHFVSPQGEIFICFSSNSSNTGLYLTKPNPLLLTPKIETSFLKSSPREPWNIAMEYIALGLGHRKMINTGGSYATIDTTFNAISGPTEHINLINSIIGTDENGVIDCRRLPFLNTIVFHFGSTGHLLLPKDYIIKSDDPFDFRQCKSAFVPDENNQWRIGLPFLARHIVVVDVTSNKIALLQLKNEY